MQIYFKKKEVILSSWGKQKQITALTCEYEMMNKADQTRTLLHHSLVNSCLMHTNESPLLGAALVPKPTLPSGGEISVTFLLFIICLV